jgi:hypothetical protein
MKITGTPLLAILLALMPSACGRGDRDSSGGANQNLVTVIARGLTLEAPEQIPSGWTTFRFRNEASMTHFAVLERVPEGIGIAEQQRQVAPVFQEGMNLLNAGDTDAAMAKFGELPEWFGKTVFLGGNGLTAPGRTSEVSVRLEPGTYLMECYVKTNGVFHSYNPDQSTFGMVHQFTVTEDRSAAPEPAATLEITISGSQGIVVAGDPVAGSNTVAVHFTDQKVHENFLGHDVHLARLEEDTDMDALASWMDWTQPGGLETPAPAEFLGGLHEMPAGATGYMTVTLEPGRYVWLAEVPGPDKKGMLHTFVIPADHS